MGHSRSPLMHNAALAALGLNWAYVPFDVAPENVEAALAGIKALGMVGVNVTVPLKETVLPFLDEVSDTVRQIGSANTIIYRDGRLYGESTDGAGFLRALEDAGQSADNRRALILGAGGSARAVAFALASRGTHCRISNRTKERAQALARDINRWMPGMASSTGWGWTATAGSEDLIVNTTSVGMTPAEEAWPSLPTGSLDNQPFVYDLIYSPAETRLMMRAVANGCGTANGVGMLVQQGAISLSLWTGLPIERIPVAVMEAAVRQSL